ncbi:hypothetical protein GCM10022382_28180 [Microbacterium invictum]
MPTTPAWRADDAAAYESLRATASTIVARLIEAGDVQKATAVRRLILSVDGFDRAAVDAAMSTLTETHGTEQ